MISYAQNFEDVILNRLFEGKANGFYIDVGAWHPVDHSVTKHFYDQGWSGINVEPSKAYWSLLQKFRPRDINLNCAVSDNCEAMDYLEMPNSGASTSIESGWGVIAKQEALAKSAKNAIKRKVECVTLADLCNEYARGKEIDFLKIDVEGSEKSVIKGGDWKSYRPRVVIVEAVAPFTNVPNYTEWESMLVKEGYVFAYFDGLNRFYVREDSRDLLVAFELPPNIFDNIKQYQGEGCIFHKKIEIGRLIVTISF